MATCSLEAKKDGGSGEGITHTSLFFVEAVNRASVHSSTGKRACVTAFQLESKPALQLSE